MTPRERLIETLTFGHPDRIPFAPGDPRESTRKAWRRQGLDGEDWREAVCAALGVEIDPVGWRAVQADFRMIPQFEEKVLSHRDGRLVVQDWKGNVCEISDRFDVTYLRTAKDFVTRRWLSCPVKTPEDWPSMRMRYDLDAPGRLSGDCGAASVSLHTRDDALVVVFSGPFWQMREWCGFEGAVHDDG